MIKVFIALLIALVIFDQAFRGGIGTETTLHLFSGFIHSFKAALADSIFTR